MCIIIAKRPEASHPSDDVIDECWKRNSHGAGFAYADANGGVTIRKGFMTLEALKAALREVTEVKGSWYLIHFRIATHGSRGPENTHPFWVTEGHVAMAHNGMLPIGDLVKDDEGRSDTSAFAEDILSKLPPNWYRNRAFLHMVEDYMGVGNKIAVIDKDGIELLNANAWNKDPDTGLYFSNYGWKPYVVHSYTGSGYTEHRGGAASTQNFRTPSASQNVQSGVHTAATEGGASSKRDRKKRCAVLGKRLGAFVSAGIFNALEASDLKKMAVEGEYDPEEVEDFIDFFVEMRTQMPGLTLDGMLISMQCRDLYECIDEVIEISFGRDETREITPKNSDEPEIDYEDVPDQKEPEYNVANTLCFIGQNVKMKIKIGRENMVRMCRITGSHAPANAVEGLNYQMLCSGNLGWIRFDAIQSIEGLITIQHPTAETLEQFSGSRVIVQAGDGKMVPAILGETVLDGDGQAVWFRSPDAPLRWRYLVNSIETLVVEALPDEPKELANKG